MKKSTIKETPGDIIRIPLTDGTHTYARILIDESYAFYDCKTDEEISDLNVILQCPILFCAMVGVFGVKEGWWKIISISLYCPEWWSSCWKWQAKLSGRDNNTSDSSSCN